MQQFENIFSQGFVNLGKLLKLKLNCNKENNYTNYQNFYRIILVFFVLCKVVKVILEHLGNILSKD